LSSLHAGAIKGTQNYLDNVEEATKRVLRRF
jgi:hypothetical protein